MSEKKNSTELPVEQVIETGKPEDDMVTIVVPRRYEEEQRRYICVNGRQCSVKTGVPVSMPRAMARVVRQSIGQHESYRLMVEKLKAMAAKPNK